MLEKSPTLGSIETSDAVKRKMAAKSHDFNLKDKVFVELFPDLADKSRAFLNRASQINASGAGTDPNGGPNFDPDDPNDLSRRQLEHNEVVGGQGFYGAVTNFLVIGGFAAFAFMVQYVIQSLAIAD